MLPPGFRARAPRQPAHPVAARVVSPAARGAGYPCKPANHVLEDGAEVPILLRHWRVAGVLRLLALRPSPPPPKAAYPLFLARRWNRAACGMLRRNTNPQEGDVVC